MELEELLSRIKLSKEKVESVGRVVGRVGFFLGCAYVCASVTSTWIVSLLMSGDPVSATMRQANKSPKISLNFERTNYRNLRKAIERRNIFNADGEFPDETVVQEEGLEANEEATCLRPYHINWSKVRLPRPATLVYGAVGG